MGCSDILLSSILSLFFSLFSLGDGLIQTEILSRRAFKPKNNHSTNNSTLVRICGCHFGQMLPVWENELDTTRNQTVRIAVGAPKLVSLNALYNEIGWESLQNRRRYHKLILLYKMMHNLIPLYLSSLVPQPVSNLSRYHLRNSNDLQTVAARTNQYDLSFLSPSIKAWNNLPDEAKQTDSVNSFKHFLKKDKRTIPKQYYYGTRKALILHTRLRTNCSSLSLDLFLQNISDSPLCSCGRIETT